ncbi:MAG: hypothetical protein LW806_03290 [Planctomycetaceae bacterium]|nr:hypothetical protein [Planctomycetaceae bacterium]
MKPTLPAAVLAALALAALSASTASPASVIVDQPAAASGDGMPSQVMLEPHAGFSCSAFDDFSIGESCELAALTVYGYDGVGGDSGFNIAVTVRFYTDPNLSNAAIAARSGTQVGGDLVFDLSGITLDPGTYWIAAQVERPLTGGGQWYWFVSDTTNGAQAMWQNPAGGFGQGSRPISISDFGASAHDMAFRLESVPAPGGLALLGVCALFGRRHR